jgi:hypothetical protein
MSLSRETMIELMALADGELEGPARERAEKLVAESEEAQRVLEAMREPAVGLWLGEAMRARAGAADGIADAVMAEIASQSEGAAARARDEGGVVRLAGPHGRRGTRRRLAAAVAAVGGALALAAAVALYARSGADSDGARAPVVSEPPSRTTGQAPGPVRSALVQYRVPPAQGVEVDEIDSPSRGVSVFEIPLGSAAAAAATPAGPSSVVIWIDDDPGSK